MTTNDLYVTWHTEVRRMFTTLSKPQLRNLTWFLVGIYLSKSVQLQEIAGQIPGQALLVSITRRLSRFLDTLAVRVRPAYEPLIRSLLERLGQTGQVRLIIDGSKVGFGHQLLMVSVAYRRRAIPVAWTWIKGNRGHSAASVQAALLTYVRSLLPVLPIPVRVEVVGDCEFGAIELIKRLEAWRWWYALRQKGSHLVKAGDDIWRPFADLVSNPGDSCWVTTALLTAKHQHPTHVLAHWDKQENEPWLLATNFPTPRLALRAYSRRMWTEELFGDLKGHGFDREDTHLRHFLKLSRLTFIVVLLYVWLIALGSQVIKRGHRLLIDRSDRRDLCVFQIGLRFIQRCLTNGLPFRISFLLVT